MMARSHLFLEKVSACTLTKMYERLCNLFLQEIQNVLKKCVYFG